MDTFGSILSQKRQKQKLIVLQKKLEHAEKKQGSAQKEVEHLKDEMSQAELAVIRQAVEECEEKLARHYKTDHEHVANLFLNERESLHKMIQSGAAPTSFQAQVVLDQILRMITNLSEETQND
jgi:hypothetical protein